jgi:hypothetical protein
LLLYGGLALMGLAFILSWWSITKYRVYYARGVNLQVPADVDEMNKRIGDDRAEHEKEVAQYQSDWNTNSKQYHAYYVANFGTGYLENLNNQMDRSLSSGTLYYRGWSTFTGWLGIITILAVVGLYVAPKFAPDPMEQWAWTAPWAAVALGGLYTLLAMLFFMNEPSENGAGYSQGIGLGCYVAILGGMAAVIGGVFEGLASAKARLQSIESDTSDDDDETPSTPADDGPVTPVRPAAPRPASAAQKRPAAPPAEKPPEKNRLMDW